MLATRRWFRAPLRRGARLPLLPFLLVAGIAALACAHPVKRRDWSDYRGPGAASFQRPELPPPRHPDPLEPLNRGVAVVNHGLVVGVVAPLAIAYRFVLPRYVRERIDRFATNLTYPRRLAANLLQGRLDGAGEETVRFAINTTLGVGGLWDPASRWGWHSTDEDFGQVFAVWGWRPSTYLMLPLAGPSTVRDAIGLVPDSLLDPATYYFPAGPILTFNELAGQVEGYQRFVESRFDPYDDAQIVWRVARQEQIDGVPVGPGEDTAAVQTLQAAFLAPRDPHFADTLRHRKVRVPTTGRELPYTFRIQPEPAPLVFLLPGLGTHRLAGGSLALAEMAWRRGFSVAVISSAMNFEFLEHASSVAVPGYAPVDARDVHVALDAVDADLAAHTDAEVTARVLMGYSLGAFHALYIAAAGPDAGDLVRFDRFLTLDAPVRLLHGLETLDAFYNAPMAYPPERRPVEVNRILLKAVAVARGALGDPSTYARVDTADLAGGDFEPGVEVPFTNLEAQYLIGLAFRRTLGEIIWVSQSRADLGILQTERSWWRRQAAYVEIGDYSFAEYFYGFVLPYYRDHLGTVASAEEMIAATDLRSLEDRLRGDDRIRHFANGNDFLTTDADEIWLTTVLGAEHVRFFPRGGHLGNLNRPEVQEAVMDAVADLLPAEPAAADAARD